MITQKWFSIICLMDLCYFSKAADFTLVSKTTKVSIVYTQHESKLDSISANLLAQDIQRVTGYLPNVFDDITKAKGSVIIIGSIESKLVRNLLGQQSKEYINLKGKWKSYLIKVLDKPFVNITSALLIAGSDKRGTAYGVFSISEKIGVSPWYLWADVSQVIKKELTILQDDFMLLPPTVKYRGIFLNDEDWGLQPWAAKTFEPETGDIDPKTYAKIFELLLRLKANFIWPAMHPSTKAFYHYPGITELEDFKGAIEDNGIVSIFASTFNKNIPKGASGWVIQEDLGHTGNSLEALPLSKKPTLDLKDPGVIKTNPPLFNMISTHFLQLLRK